eukprot:5725149-Prymnesium_polylepis.1
MAVTRSHCAERRPEMTKLRGESPHPIFQCSSGVSDLYSGLPRHWEQPNVVVRVCVRSYCCTD